MFSGWGGEWRGWGFYLPLALAPALAASVPRRAIKSALDLNHGATSGLRSLAARKALIRPKFPGCVRSRQPLQPCDPKQSWKDNCTQSGINCLWNDKVWICCQCENKNFKRKIVLLFDILRVYIHIRLFRIYYINKFSKLLLPTKKVIYCY